MKAQHGFVALLTVALGVGCAGGRGVPARTAQAAPAPRSPQTLQEGDFSIQVGTLTREYRLHIPATIGSGAKASLVVVLHGGAGKPDTIARASRMDAVADAHGFLVAYPAGIRGRGPGGSWNGGDCCGVAMQQQVDDVGFISTLIDTLVRDRPVDPARVYVTGMSNGAIMTYRLACGIAGKIAAIAPVAGALMDASCHPSRPVPVLIFHGTADKEVKVDGGLNPRSQARRAFPPLSDTIQFWVRQDRCTGPGTVVAEKGDARETSYGPCAAGTDVAVWRIEGGGHTWPGGNESLPQFLVGKTTHDISASEEMWRFFEKYTVR